MRPARLRMQKHPWPDAPWLYKAGSSGKWKQVWTGTCSQERCLTNRLWMIGRKNNRQHLLGCCLLFLFVYKIFIGVLLAFRCGFVKIVSTCHVFWHCYGKEVRWWTGSTNWNVNSARSQSPTWCASLWLVWLWYFAATCCSHRSTCYITFILTLLWYCKVKYGGYSPFISSTWNQPYFCCYLIVFLLFYRHQPWKSVGQFSVQCLLSGRHHRHPDCRFYFGRSY